MHRICIASCNTAKATELCIRSLRRHAGIECRISVGDCGSEDGSLDMLRRFERQGWIDLEVARRGHAEWLDHWLGTTADGLLLFSDSDMEYRRDGCIAQLVARQRASGAALVAAELLPEIPNYVEPVNHHVVRLASRPAPWLLVLDPAQLRDAESFGFRADWAADDVPEGVRFYDVGAWLYRQLVRDAGACEVMPAGFGRSYRHFAGLSWRGRRGRSTARWYAMQAYIAIRIARLRRAELSQSTYDADDVHPGSPRGLA